MFSTMEDVETVKISYSMSLKEILPSFLNLPYNIYGICYVHKHKHLSS